jgi:hypothetical protein
MTVNEVRKLNGMVEGEKLFFQVKVPIRNDLNVLDLRRLAWEERKSGLLGDFDIKDSDLVLLKVRRP